MKLRAGAVSIALFSWTFVGLIFSLASAVAAQSLRAEIVQQLGHHGFAIGLVAFSPDGRTILTGGYDNTALLWDVETGRELRRLTGHSGWVSSGAFSPDGLSVLTGSSDKTVRLWDVATGREKLSFVGHSSGVTSAAFSPDGRTALTASEDDTLRLWDVASGREVRRIAGPMVQSVAFSPDGRTVLTGSYDHSVRLWNLATGREQIRYSGHTDSVKSVAFSPDGRMVLTASEDKTVRLWEAATGRELRQFKGHSNGVLSAAFSPDGLLVLTGSSDNTARLWDVKTGRELQKLTGYTDWVLSVAFSPDGRKLLTGGNDRDARMWDAATGRELRRFKGRNEDPASVAYSPDGKTMASASGTAARLWDVATGRELLRFVGHTDLVKSVAYSPDGQLILTGSFDKSARLWDVKTGREVRQFIGHSGTVFSAAFSSDGRNLITGSADKTARLWDAATGNQLKQLSGHREAVYSVAIAPDGHSAVTASGDQTVRLWDVATGRELRRFKGHTSIVDAAAFSPDGRTLLTGSLDNTARLWDVATARQLRQLNAQSETVDSVAFSPDGRTLLTASWDSTARLSDAATGRELKRFTGHLGRVNFAVFSPDGQKVLTASGDGIRIWDTATQSSPPSIVAFEDGEWLTITPEGFFDASSPKAAQNLNVVRGLDVSSIDQVYNVLYRPDLVREKLAGDPDGKVKAAAAKLDLEKVMASGSAPKVAITSPPAGSSSTDEVGVEATVSDQGGGIGKVEWRVNGVTSGIETRGLERVEAAASAGKSLTVKRSLALERGENRIEVLAYNAKDLIASEPASMTVTWDGEKTATPPKLFVMAVGVNDYYDSRLRLSYAVPDATAIAEGFRKAGTGLYAAVDVTTVLDTDVTIANLDKAFTELGKKAQPRDVFVFFLAGHGKTKNGRYYFLPRDFRYEDEDSIEKAGMDQDKFQAWFAKIPARKSILLYDTCESGSLTGTKARGSDIDERLGALNRMTRATGRTFLTATTDDAPALEGYHGHGVFTYALLDALDHADVNKNGLIEVSELADYIDQKVPDISFEAFRLRQIPQRNIVGNNFALTNKAEVLSTAKAGSSGSQSANGSSGGLPRPAPTTTTNPNSSSADAAVPTKPTHVIIAPTDVKAASGDGSATVMQLPPGTQVQLIKTENGWVLIARNGQKIGYVQQTALAGLQ